LPSKFTAVIRFTKLTDIQTLLSSQHAARLKESLQQLRLLKNGSSFYCGNPLPKTLKSYHSSLNLAVCQ